MNNLTEESGISRQALQEATGLHGIWGRIVSNAIYDLLGMKAYNKLYNSKPRPEGPDFSKGVLEDLGVTWDIPEEQLARIPSEGGFITVSNHHFGSLDGMILNAVIASRRPDYKILTTFYLSLIKNLRDSFIPVDNFASGGAKSIAGIRQALSHIHNGGALGLFPAGEVATWQKKADRTSWGKKRIVEDKPWAENMMNLIKKSGLPVIPIYFDGQNSRLFHILGQIHPALRTLRLVREMFNKKGTHIKVRIGQPIAPAQIAGFDTKALGAYLRNYCYALEAQCIESRPMTVDPASQEPIADAVDPELVRSQMEALDGSRILFETGDYRAYLIKQAEAPDALRELYRLREVTFRAIGEGSGKAIDTDIFDAAYDHLILWSISNREIVGAYRFGYGSELIKPGDPSGFYSASLLRFGPDATGLLSRSMELGRSFIVEKYQREVLPLKMLFAGLCVGTTLKPGVDYTIGLVSFSAALPEFYKSLAVYFLQKYFAYPDSEFSKPTHPFRYDFLRIDPEALLSGLDGDIDAFDRLIGAISDGKFRIPVLARKYFNGGAKATCFNVDPTFSNCLDAMIVLRLCDFPQLSIKAFVRSVPQDLQDRVLRHFFGDALTA